MHYINLAVLLITLGFVIGVYIHTDKKIDYLDKKLSDRMDRLYDILVLMRFREIKQEQRDKAVNE